MGEMTNATPCNPHKEEDEGYLTAETGRSLSENPYPRGTIRYEEWRRGWQIKRDETKREGDEGYLAAGNGQSLSENPYPRGTIRYEEWRCGWQAKRDEIQRAVRLAETRSGSEHLSPDVSPEHPPKTS
jgi:ribosome modulation factor